MRMPGNGTAERRHDLRQERSGQRNHDAIYGSADGPACHIAVKALDAYLKQLRGLAKVALRRRPDLLKKLNA
jgi:hypothetical protein